MLDSNLKLPFSPSLSNFKPLTNNNRIDTARFDLRATNKAASVNYTARMPVNGKYQIPSLLLLLLLMQQQQRQHDIFAQ